MGEKGARLTTASQSLCEDVMARLEPIGGVSSRKMFGGFGIFHEGAMFGIVSKTTLFFKADETTLGDYKAAKSRQHRPMPYYSVPANVLAKKSALHEWARAAIDVAHASAGTKATKKK